jgi:hypothetical protein
MTVGVRRAGSGAPGRERLIGGGELVAKSSAVNAAGALRLEPFTTSSSAPPGLSRMRTGM